MRITRVTTGVTDLLEAARFYETLQLPTEQVAGALHVQIGSSLLRLEHRPDEERCDHLAFDVPAAGFDSAKQWLRARATLLGRDGLDQFEGPEAWNSVSVYFAGPSNSVLELIARRNLSSGSAGAEFDAGRISHISEVGIAASSVPRAAAKLLSQADLTSFGGPVGETFTPVGDEHGLLILAAAGRAWAPTIDRFATPASLHVTATGTRSARILVDEAVIEVIEPDPAADPIAA